MDAIGGRVEDVKAFLASPHGRRARAAFAGAVILAAPLLMRLPAVRAHPVGRLIALAGGAAVLVKAAEAIRDWEPELATV